MSHQSINYKYIFTFFNEAARTEYWVTWRNRWLGISGIDDTDDQIPNFMKIIMHIELGVKIMLIWTQPNFAHP